MTKLTVQEYEEMMLSCEEASKLSAADHQHEPGDKEFQAPVNPIVPYMVDRCMCHRCRVIRALGRVERRTERISELRGKADAGE